MEVINGERIKQVRELRGLTQKELAEKVQINQSAVAKLENGSLSPSDDVLNRLVIQTGFPKSFFKQNPDIDFPLGSLLFRCKASITLKEKNEATQYGRVFFEVYSKVKDKVTSLNVCLPRLNESPELAAKMTRSALGLSPYTPVKNLINALEKNGVLVFPLPKEFENKDAYSLWANNYGSKIPLVFMASGKPGDRIRFSVSHELGHLVLHGQLTGNRSQFEKEADRFAAEFLMPSEAMKKVMVPPVTLYSLAALKPAWGVSIQALAYRAKELEIISSRQFKYLMMQISKKGWRKNEPENLNVPTEKPRALRKMVETIYGDPINYKDLSQDVCLTTAFLKELMSGFIFNKKNEVVKVEESGRFIEFKRKEI